MKVVLSYLLSIGGVGLVAYAVHLAMAVNVDYPAARFRIISALRSQPWQAEMLTRTKPGSFYDGIHAAMKTAGMTGLRDPDQVAMASMSVMSPPPNRKPPMVTTQPPVRRNDRPSSRM